MQPELIFVLYFAGVMLLFLDIFVIPTHVAGYVAIGMIITSIYFVFQRWGFLSGTGLSLVTMGATIAAARVAVARLTQHRTLLKEEGYVATEPGLERLVGQRGVTATALRPAGFARLDGRRVDVVTLGEMIDEGVAVEVVQVEGNRVVVREVRAGAADGAGAGTEPS